MSRRRVLVVFVVALFGGIGTALAFVVTDAAVTARNAVTAALKNNIVALVERESAQLERMTARLDGSSLGQYRLTPTPTSPVPGASNPFVRAAWGDEAAPGAYAEVARPRDTAPLAVDAVTERGLATLDVADSTLTVGAEQLGAIRRDEPQERAAMERLSATVTDASAGQSATAVLDKITAASAIEARQKQERTQMLTVLAEQLLVDTKRARDTEAATLNMQRNRLLRADSEDSSLISGAADDLRTWRQP